MSTSPITSQCRNSGDLGAMLRCFRERRFWTQAALAENAGLPEKTISSLETGTRRRPHLTTLNLLAEALELDTDDRAAFISLRGGGGAGASAQPVQVSVTQTQLPLPATSFLGREDLVLRLQEMFTHPDNRLLTLTGIGGIGKTRLALRVAEGLAETTANGVFVIDFTGISDPALVPATIAQGLGVQPSTGRSIDDAVIDFCATRRVVVILDNFEHVVSAARFVDRLIAGSVQLAVLVTSRERLALKRERLVSVRPLTLPPVLPEGETTTLEVAMQSEAVQLFVERAQDVQPTFEITEANVDDVAEICRRLDGIPLAIELAAARIPHVGSPSYLRQRLHQSLSWLTSNLRDQADRHRTMRAAIDWSYESLDHTEQAIFRQLSVFAGGFTIDAIEGTGVRGQKSERLDSSVPCSLTPVPSLDGITSLVEKNLVQLYDGPDGGTRYRLLEMIREYGLEKLARSGEEDQVRTAHAETFLAMAERGETELSGPNHAGWVARLKTEQDNIRTAFEWSITAGHAERALRFGSALWRFWAATGRVQEGSVLLQRAVALEGPLPPRLRAKALRRLGNMLVERANYRAAREYFAASLDTAQADSDTFAATQAIIGLGFVALNLGDYERAQADLEKVLNDKKLSEHVVDQAVVMQLLGIVSMATDHFEQAANYHMESLKVRRRSNNALGAAYSAVWLGQLARLTQHREEASRWLDDALSAFRQSGDRPGEGYALFERAMLARDQGHEQVALTLLKQCLEVRQQVGDLQTTIDTIEAVALVLWDRADFHEGAKLYAAASTWREESGVVSHPPLRRVFEAATTRVRLEIGDALFGSLWRLGQSMTLDQMAQLAHHLIEQ